MSRAIIGTLVPGHGHRLECGHCFNCNGLEYTSQTGGLTRWPGFLLRHCCWLFLGPSLLSWIPIRSRPCCEEPGRVLVWIFIAAMVTKVVEVFAGVIIQFWRALRGEFEHSAIRSASLFHLCTLMQRL